MKAFFHRVETFEFQFATGMDFHSRKPCQFPPGRQVQKRIVGCVMDRCTTMKKRKLNKFKWQINTAPEAWCGFLIPIAFYFH